MNIFLVAVAQDFIIAAAHSRRNGAAYAASDSGCTNAPIDKSAVPSLSGIPTSFPVPFYAMIGNDQVVLPLASHHIEDHFGAQYM